uniref:acid phosphatase n=1 Tax=Trichuris muris TaxID=70415 RepID=A0A5S6QJK4_TRIMR
MQRILRIILLVLATNQVLCGVENNETLQPETACTMKLDALQTVRSTLESLLQTLKEWFDKIQSLLTSVPELAREKPIKEGLRLVVAVWRHGSRAPLSNIFELPDEQLKMHWPRGLQQLTSKGIEEQHQLGRFLHERYKSFISNYSKETIYVRSADSSRTIMSALAIMNGFIPSTDEGLVGLSQKIPIYKVAARHDRALKVTYVNCPPPFRPFIMDVAKSSSEQLSAGLDPKLLQLVARGLKRKPGVMDLFQFADSLICYHYDGKASLIPTWAQSAQLYEQVLQLYIMANLAQQTKPEYQALRGSNLFNEIADELVKKATEGQNRSLEFIGYSAHDMTLLALLVDWGAVSPSLFPGFSSCIMIELHQETSGYYVEIWYRSGHEKELTQLRVKECSERCKLEQFVKIAKTYASVDISAHCQKFKEMGLEFVENYYT